MIKVESLKSGQYIRLYRGESRVTLKTWGNPFLAEDKWTIQATCCGDYEWLITDDDKLELGSFYDEDINYD